MTWLLYGFLVVVCGALGGLVSSILWYRTVRRLWRLEAAIRTERRIERSTLEDKDKLLVKARDHTNAALWNLTPPDKRFMD